MPPVLTHGDLWSGNLLGQADGGLAVIDPAISYTWAEVDLSMLWSCPRPPVSDRFFDVYQELNPSPPGWAERMPLLNLRELLSVAAQEVESAWAVERTRKILAPFYPRQAALADRKISAGDHVDRLLKGASTDGAVVHRASVNDTGAAGSTKRIDDPDSGVVFAVAQVFGQDFCAAHHAGCLDDRGVPV